MDRESIYVSGNMDASGPFARYENGDGLDVIPTSSPRSTSVGMSIADQITGFNQGRSTEGGWFGGVFNQLFGTFDKALDTYIAGITKYAQARYLMGMASNMDDYARYMYEQGKQMSSDQYRAGAERTKVPDVSPTTQGENPEPRVRGPDTNRDFDNPGKKKKTWRRP